MSHFEIQFFQIRYFQLKLFYSFFLEMMMSWLSSFQKVIFELDFNSDHYFVKVMANFKSRSITFLVQLWLSRSCCCILSTFWRQNCNQTMNWIRATGKNVRNTLKYSRFFCFVSTKMSEHFHDIRIAKWLRNQYFKMIKSISKSFCPIKMHMLSLRGQ